MKKILVPIDFSPISMNSLEYALEIAAKHNSAIEVLHIYKFPEPGHYMPEHLFTMVSNNEEANASAAFIEYVKNSSPRVHELMGKVAVNFNIYMGFVPDAIITHAKDNKFDLIVMGTTGASGAKAAFFGSIAGEVMENAYCPVLAIPENAKFNGVIRKIAVTSDFTEEDKKVFNYILDWSQPFNAEVKCFHVDLNHTEQFTKKMDKLAANYTGNERAGFSVVDESNLQQGIEKFVQEENIDVLAMLIHKRSFFRELFHYSQAKNLSYHTNLPILAVQAHLF